VTGNHWLKSFLKIAGRSRLVTIYSKPRTELRIVFLHTEWQWNFVNK